MSPNQRVGVASAPSAHSTDAQCVDDKEAAPEKCEKSEATMHSTKQSASTSLQKTLDALRRIEFTLPTGAVFPLANKVTLGNIDKRLATIESLLQQLMETPGQTCLQLNDTERRVVAAVATTPLKGSAIARRVGCDFNSCFKSTLSLLVRTGVLVKKPQGYLAAQKSGHVRIDSTDE